MGTTSEEQLKEQKQMLQTEDISQYPSVFQQARNLLKQTILSGAEFINGNRFLATAEKAAARLEICKSCEFFDKEKERCFKCGCFMKTKVHLEMSGCPVNKWGDLTQLSSIKTREEIAKDGEAMIALRNIPKPQNMPSYPSTFTADEMIEFQTLVRDMISKNGGSFSYKSVDYTVTVKEDKTYFISGSLSPNPTKEPQTPSYPSTS